MTRISFTDTNVSIAYVFSFDPFNNYSNIIFEEYMIITWSKLVKKEFKKVFKRKNKELRIFIDNLRLSIEESGLEFFNIEELMAITKKI